MKIVRAHIIISGKVQHVLFRANMIKEGRELKITGWVRNLEDGTVEAVIEGPENNVKELILWCNEGPRLAKVEKVEVKYEVPTGEFKDFSRR